MGTITIQNETCLNPITLIGKEAGICWGANTTDDSKNYKRGLDCIKANHGRTLEFPQLYLIVDGYSARVIRELYTHIGGAPTRLQASTRYIDYESGFKYITPPLIDKNNEAKAVYDKAMDSVQNALRILADMGFAREDCGMLLPLAMETKIVFRTNLRNMIDMSHQRLCSRAYWEYREMMHDIMNALSDYSEEWKYLVENYFKPKCEVMGFCTETYSCGRKPKAN